MNITLKKITLTSILSCCALIAFVIENILPPIFIPGARIGLSNIFILVCLITLGIKYGFCALLIKIVLGSIFSGNISAMLYSLPSGLISFSIESFLIFYTKKFSLISISIVGAIINSLIQNIVFCIEINSFDYLAYLPYLTLIALFSGLLVGFITYLIIKRIPDKTIKTFLTKGDLI